MTVKVKIKKKPTLDSPLPIKKESTNVSLPTEVSHPSNQLNDYSILLYGEKKIGKTTLAAQFDNAFFLMFEPGGKSLSIYQRPVNNWDELKQYVKLLKNDKQFKTIVLDTVDIAYKLCTDYVCKKLMISHPSEEEWGKGWSEVREEFAGEITKILSMKKGVIFISHAALKDVKTRTGDEYSRIVPTMAKQARETLEGIVDIWVYYCYNKRQRSLIIEGDDHVGAGHRITNKFRYSSGEPILEVDMGKSPKEAYSNFIAAFNNQLEKVEEKPKVSLKIKRRSE